MSSWRGSRAEARSLVPLSSRYASPTEPYRSSIAEPAGAAAELAQPSWLSTIGETFKEEIDQVKGLAVGTLLGVVRDLATEAVPPQLAEPVKETMDKLTKKLGGVPIQGPVLPDTEEDRSETPGQGLRPETGRPPGTTHWTGQTVGTAHG